LIKGGNMGSKCNDCKGCWLNTAGSYDVWERYSESCSGSEEDIKFWDNNGGIPPWENFNDELVFKYFKIYKK
jgi:hypothetical protein